MNNTEKIIVSPKQFATMSSKEVCNLINTNSNYHIVGYAKGVDRRIIERKAR